MCGIVGYTGDTDAMNVLIPALKRLEYRGYDSAGIATVNGYGLDTRKAVGKIADLEAQVAAAPPHGRAGIAHTRWATHGRPTEVNAHPHVDCPRRLALVHNGIIENYRDLRKHLASHGHRFRSETDTEVIVHLIEHYRNNGLFDAVHRATQDLRGAYAFACISAEDPETLIVVRRGSSPLVIGHGDGEAFVASDIPALLGRTRDMVVLDDGEIAILKRGAINIRTLEGHAVRRDTTRITWDAEAAERGGHPHFMLKEILEQPEAVSSTVRDHLDFEARQVQIAELGISDRDIIGLNRLSFVAAGTSLHAALIGKYLVEDFAKLSADVDMASEFRYRRPVLDSRILTVPISQSGETADTLAAARYVREHGSRVVAVCNIVGSSLAREADGVLFTRAGIEIGVAATKTFTAQLAAMLLLALKLGSVRGMMDEELRYRAMREIEVAPELMREVLLQRDKIRAVAQQFAQSRDFLYLGRGLDYPLALEGALKLKEISYIHAEGYAAGEMKHGPIALIDQEMPVVAIAPKGPTYEKMASNVEEVKARDGRVIAIVTEGDETIAAQADAVIFIPPAAPWIQPLLVALPLQLLAYYIAVERGCDVDQPRNLAKSVTVE
jgi:glucosamine--fructose-6-phosphate aminotransferase (isomerizing)